MYGASDDEMNVNANLTCSRSEGHVV